MSAVLLVVMRKNLPYLDQERLSIIFNHFYDAASDREIKNGFKEEKLAQLLKVLQTMQLFNYQHRPDDTRELFGLMSNVFNFEVNSEGTTYWLSLILAVKELYGFSDDKIVSVMEQFKAKR